MEKIDFKKLGIGGQQELLEKVIERAQKYFADAEGIHGWDHSLRVLRLSLVIGKKIKADPKIVAIAAILHDIAREDETNSGGTVSHAERGALIADKILEDLGVDKETRGKVHHCISSHRTKNDINSDTPEAKAVYDADKLDAIGAVGIARDFMFAERLGAHLHNTIPLDQTKEYTSEDTAYREYMVSLRFIKDKMLTKPGKKLAKDRHNFMVKFFSRFLMEVEGRL